MIQISKTALEYLSPPEKPVECDGAWLDTTSRALLPFDDVAFAYATDIPDVHLIISGRIQRIVPPQWIEIETDNNFKRMGFLDGVVTKGSQIIRLPRDPKVLRALSQYFTSFNRYVVRQYNPTVHGQPFFV